MAANNTAPFDVSLESSRATLIDHYAITAGSNEYAVVSEYSNLIGLAATLVPLTAISVLARRRTRR